MVCFILTFCGTKYPSSADVHEANIIYKSTLLEFSDIAKCSSSHFTGNNNSTTEFTDSNCNEIVNLKILFMYAWFLILFYQFVCS